MVSCYYSKKCKAVVQRIPDLSGTVVGNMRKGENEGQNQTLGRVFNLRFDTGISLFFYISFFVSGLELFLSRTIVIADSRQVPCLIPES